MGSESEGRVVGKVDRDMLGVEDENFSKKDDDVLDADSEVSKGTMGWPARRPLLPVAVWAQLKSINLKDAVKCGNINEKFYFDTKEFLILLLTNRTVKIKNRDRSDYHCYVPLENVRSFQVERDLQFERRIEKASDEGGQ